ncbi:uncharacterized protein METZ01_LOCUS325182 [marine metagenome]|uniref:Uncharacterized protein n=1 Tax=marine metagenome TaxID=408172 RepID=A0A382PI04_9ZZZZ
MKTKILLNKIGRYGLEDIEAFVRKSIDLFDP